MFEYTDRSDLGEGQLGTFEFETDLRIGERPIHSFSIKSRISGILSSLNPTIEGFYALSSFSKNALQDLRENGLKVRISHLFRS